MPDFSQVGYIALLTMLLIAMLAVCISLYRRMTRLARKLSDLDQQNRSDRDDWEHAKSSLRLQQAWYKLLFNETSNMVLVYGVNADGMPGKFLDVNDATCRRLGRSRETMLTLTPQDIEDVQTAAAMPRYTRAELVTLADEDLIERENVFIVQFVRDIINRREVVYERDYITRTGTRIPVEIRARAIEFEGRTFIMCVVRNISATREVQRELRQSQRRSHDFFARSPFGVAIYDSQRNLVNVNLACLKMFGAPDRTEFARFNMFENPFLTDRARQQLAGGQTVRCEMTIDFDDVRRLGLFSTTRTAPVVLDVWINNLGLNDDFRPEGYIVEVQDITRQRQAESALRQREQMLRQSQKLEAIGTISGGIAHDFNNILTPILGYSEMIRQTAPENGTIYEYAGEVLRAGQRAKSLVNQILTFSRQTDSGENTLVKVTAMVKEVLKQLEAAVPGNIRINRVIKTKQDIVLADPTQIHQILMNLCTNAIHAMRETGGELEVRLSDFLIDERARSSYHALSAGRYLRLSVKDTGCGMDNRTMERIFEPFFTTKPQGEGTGMGLAVIHGIVTGLKGAIKVESELGRGSVFHVILPTVSKSEEYEMESAPPIPRGTETILIVDDEPDIQKMAGDMLTAMGYAPVVCSSGAEALGVFEINPDHFDLVVTDQVMPNMTGTELSAKLKRLRPDVPILLCTGFSEDLLPHDLNAAGISEILMKPVGMQELGEAIRRCLDTDTHPPVPFGTLPATRSDEDNHDQRFHDATG